MKVLFKKLHKNAIIPTKATEYAAAFDLYTCDDTIIFGRERRVIPTGIAIELPLGTYADVRPRSGCSLRGIDVKIINSNEEIQGAVDADVLLGTIDCDYRGEIGIIVRNNINLSFVIQKGTRLAQLLIHAIPQVELIEATELSTTKRGENGYGSTGK